MSRIMSERGHDVYSSDLEFQGYGEGNIDFLATNLPKDVNWIITNPPFSLADQFIRKAFEHRVSFAFLLKSQYWHAKKRVDLFYEMPPTDICPLTWRPDFLFKKRGKGSPLMDVMWCVWDMDRWPCVTEYKPIRKGISHG